jgi:hypothetical protein
VRVGQTIETVHATTSDLAHELQTIAERHATDHAVYHVGRMLAERCRATAETLAPFAEQYQQHVVDADQNRPLSELGERVRRGTAALTGRTDESGLLLIRDLRQLAMQAHGAQMDWTILRQGAAVARDQPLMDAATVGQDEMKRVVTWLTTRIKETAPQVLAG